jgi:hypothetical protein
MSFGIPETASSWRLAKLFAKRHERPTAFTTPLAPKLRLNCLLCHVLLFLVRGGHSRDREFGAIQIPGDCDRVAGCFRQLFLGA